MENQISTDFGGSGKNSSSIEQNQLNQQHPNKCESLSNSEFRTMLVQTKVQKSGPKCKNQNTKKTRVVLHHQRTMSQDTHQQLSTNKKSSFEDQIKQQKNGQKNPIELKSSKQILKNPSLRKIKKTMSCNEQIGQDNLQQSAQNFKKVKFEEIIDEQQKQDEVKERNKIDKMSQKDIDKYYQNLKLPNNNEQAEKQKQSSSTFMSFLCGLLRLKPDFIQRSKNKIEKRLLRLNSLKISGQRQQMKLLQQINKILTCQQYSQEGKYWNKLGFITNHPMKQLQGTGVLTLLQWRNFVISHQQEAVKFCNFCIQANISLLQFHKLATQVYCSQLQDCNLQGKNWNEYQQLYNTLILVSTQDLVLKSKSSKIEQLSSEWAKIIQKKGIKLQKERNKVLKTKQMKK